MTAIVTAQSCQRATRVSKLRVCHSCSWSLCSCCPQKAFHTQPLRCLQIADNIAGHSRSHARAVIASAQVETHVFICVISDTASELGSIHEVKDCSNVQTTTLSHTMLGFLRSLPLTTVSNSTPRLVSGQSGGAKHATQKLRRDRGVPSTLKIDRYLVSWTRSRGVMTLVHCDPRQK